MAQHWYRVLSGEYQPGDFTVMSLSSKAIAAMNAQETGEIFVLLLTINHSSLGAPLRFCPTNVRPHTLGTTEGIYSNGDFYTAFPFEITLPNQSETEPPQARLRIDNASRLIIDNIRQLTSPPQIILQVVLADTPDTVEVGPLYMTLHELEYNAQVIEGTLGPEDVLNQGWPAHKFTPQNTPNIF